MKTKIIGLFIVICIAFGSLSTVSYSANGEREGWSDSYIGLEEPNPLAEDLAVAMGVDLADLVSATFSVDPIAGAVVTDTVGFLAPTDGTTFVMISSGNAQPLAFPEGWIGTPDDFLSVNNGNPSGTDPLGYLAYDIAILNLTLTAPDWAKSLSIDFRFMSEEYPEYVGTVYNDYFSCLLEGTNIAFDTLDNIINVNNDFFDPAITPEGTVFDGTTVLLTAKAPITGGATFTLDFIVGDAGDSIYDTAVFLDNFHFSTEEIEEPVVGPTIWSSDSLGNEKNTFMWTETVYVAVPATGETVRLYVVADQNVWNDGDPLTDVSDGAEPLTLDPGPGTQVIQVWGTPLTVGSYDIVEDRDDDGLYDAGADGVDSIAEVGFTVTPPVEVGWIEGTVTDADTTLTLEGATVEANGFSDVTDPSGFYSIEVPPGEYDVTAQMTGYESQTVTGVSVADGQTVTVDFALNPIVGPTIESCNSTGAKQDTFFPGENMYVVGDGYTPLWNFTIYVVADVTTWNDGMAIPPRVPGTAYGVASDSDGNIDPWPVWGAPLTVGKYDIVVDVDDNGIYDAGIDALDDSDVQVTAGFFVIPEVPLGTIMASAAMIIALVCYFAFPKFRKKQIGINP